ncbi:MAG: MFS transporter, partial [Oscillospiraceae bacterium]
MGTKSVNRYIKLLILALGAVSIYLLPYLRWTYYDTLVAAVNLTNAQFAATMSVYGIAAMIFYAPGGYFADKFSANKMLAFAFTASGILGI